MCSSDLGKDSPPERSPSHPCQYDGTRFVGHRDGRHAMPPEEGVDRHPRARPRVVVMDHDESPRTKARPEELEARRELVVYTRDLEHAVYAHPAVIDAFKQFAISGRGGVARILVQDPSAALTAPHPLLALSQRLSSAFQLRTPQDPEDMQYPSVYVANDRDGFLFRLLGSRYEGEWSEAQPARSRQLNEEFRRVWERCRPCTEFRALGL